MGVVVALFIVPIMFVIGAVFRGIVGSVFGALAGWFLALTPFGDWALSAALGMGYNGDLVELGALAAFVGAFFTSAGSNSSDK